MAKYLEDVRLSGPSDLIKMSQFIHLAFDLSDGTQADRIINVDFKPQTVKVNSIQMSGSTGDEILFIRSTLCGDVNNVFSGINIANGLNSVINPNNEYKLINNVGGSYTFYFIDGLTGNITSLTDGFVLILLEFIKYY